jgi:hypothetical protein
MLMSTNSGSIKKTVFIERVTLAFSVICSVSIIGWLFYYSSYGIDFTDESFYLVWMSNPFNYALSATQFGFIYHPLYLIFDGNIAALRQVNILLTFSLTWAFCNVFIKTIFDKVFLRNTHRFIISGAFATAGLVSLIFAGAWLPTLSYNSLALQALLIAATGILLAEKHVSHTSVTGWFLIGISGWLTFMGKPTTAAALCLVIGLYLFVTKKLSVRLLAVALLTVITGLIFSALSIDGSIFVFIARLKGGVEIASTLGGGHSVSQLLRWDEFQLDSHPKEILIISTISILLVAYLVQAKIKILVFCGFMLLVAIAVAILLMVLGFVHETLNTGQFQNHLLWAVPFAAILFGISKYRYKDLSLIFRMPWALAFTLLVFPHVYAFGTGGNYWILASNAGVFWIFAGLIFLRPITSNGKLVLLLLPFGFAVQLLTVALVMSGMESPYRQPQPLHQNNSKTEIGKPSSTLMLSKGFSQYFNEAVRGANQSGFKKGIPMIDLTGQSPGILYAMGASNIGQAWTIGGYPGSEALAIAALSKVTCQELAAAWLLSEPYGPRKIEPKILLSFNADIATDFEIVATFKTAEGAGGYKDVRVQQLLKPVRSFETAMNACAAGRIAKL